MSSSEPIDGSVETRSLSVPLPQNGTNSTPSLSELSPNDKTWDERRTQSDSIERHFDGTEFQRYATRINDCSQLLDFRLVPGGDGAYKLKLAAARFCHVRTCSVCAWRRSLVYRARAYKALPQIVSDYPTARYLFVTLTVKNCKITELRDTIKWMNESFARLTKLKRFPAIGYLKTTEVTRSKDGTAHPHFHILLMVKRSYFGRDYIKQSEWVEMWKKSLRVDYKPIMDVQALKSDKTPEALLIETIKYQSKPNDLVFAHRDWFLEYVRQVHGTKAFALGGLFRKHFREMDQDVSTDDMIGNDGENEVDEGHLVFGWRRSQKKYRMIDNGV